MTVSAADYLKGQYNATQMLGDKAIVSDGTMVIEGFESISLLTKQFPWPVLTTQGEIEIPLPMGATGFQPQQAKIGQQGPISLMETVAGQVHDALEQILSGGGRFQATVYEGTPDKFRRGYKIRDCFIQADNPDRDFESRSQVMTYSGTLFFHYFGETVPGNSL